MIFSKKDKISTDILNSPIKSCLELIVFIHHYNESESLCIKYFQNKIKDQNSNSLKKK